MSLQVFIKKYNNPVASTLFNLNRLESNQRHEFLIPIDLLYFHDLQLCYDSSS